jgi:hypothetical protein
MCLLASAFLRQTVLKLLAPRTPAIFCNRPEYYTPWETYTVWIIVHYSVHTWTPNIISALLVCRAVSASTTPVCFVLSYNAGGDKPKFQKYFDEQTTVTNAVNQCKSQLQPAIVGVAAVVMGGVASLVGVAPVVRSITISSGGEHHSSEGHH